MYSFTPKHFTFISENRGPSLLVFGAIHGDEICGPEGIRRMMKKIEKRELNLLKGSVTFVPVCNPRAYIAKKRFTEDNLNRIFHKTDKPRTYEARLANNLCLIADSADFLLDIHSMYVPGPVNVFVDYPTTENLLFAKTLGAEYTIFDWPKIYESNPYGLKPFTTDKYMHDIGKAGIVLECGQHNDPRSILVAEESIVKTLAHLGMISKNRDFVAPGKARFIYMKKMYVKGNENDRLLKDWTHLELVPAGTHIAKLRSSKYISSSVDSVIMFPKPYAATKEEWFYLGELAESVNRD